MWPQSGTFRDSNKIMNAVSKAHNIIRIGVYCCSIDMILKSGVGCIVLLFWWHSDGKWNFKYGQDVSKFNQGSMVNQSLKKCKHNSEYGLRSTKHNTMPKC